MKQLDELLMGVAVEDELAAIGVESDLKHAVRLADEAGVGEGVAVGFEVGHDVRPYWGRPEAVGVKPS